MQEMKVNFLLSLAASATKYLKAATNFCMNVPESDIQHLNTSIYLDVRASKWLISDAIYKHFDKGINDLKKVQLCVVNNCKK